MIIVKSGRDDQVGGAGTPTHRDNNHNFTIQARSPPYRSLYRSPYRTRNAAQPRDPPHLPFRLLLTLPYAPRSSAASKTGWSG